jgi:hypothetical protein
MSDIFLLTRASAVEWRDLAEDGRTLVANAREPEALATIRRLRARGLSLRRIAAELDRRGIPPRQGGGGWVHTAVAKLLRTDPIRPTRETEP